MWSANNSHIQRKKRQKTGVPPVHLNTQRKPILSDADAGVPHPQTRESRTSVARTRILAQIPIISNPKPPMSSHHVVVGTLQRSVESQDGEPITSTEVQLSSLNLKPRSETPLALHTKFNSVNN